MLPDVRILVMCSCLRFKQDKSQFALCKFVLNSVPTSSWMMIELFYLLVVGHNMLQNIIYMCVCVCVI